MSDFPERQPNSERLEELEGTGAEAGPAPPLRAFVLGLDDVPRPMARAEVEDLGDPFTRHLLLQGAEPLTLAALAEALDDLPDDVRFGERNVFVVAEGAAFAAGRPEVAANARLVIVWRRDPTAKPDLFVSAVASPDDPTTLLQVVAWSEPGGTFHFFERARDDSGWLWAGNSHHALAPPTRGRGPFDSHVNGSLVMKELKAPWVHWHSQSSSIPRSVAFPTPEADKHPLFEKVTGAEVLEDVVRQAVGRWTTRRLAHDTRDGRLHEVRTYARQLVTTTAVNLASTDRSLSAPGSGADLALPSTFFYDRDALAGAYTAATGEPLALDNDPVPVRTSRYVHALAMLGSHVIDTHGLRVAGETHFAFVVPERAFEDTRVVTRLIDAEALSPRLALAALMVDFPNPVFSARRARLLRHFPAEAALGDRGEDLDRQVLAALRPRATAGSAEAEFLTWWEAPDLAAEARATLDRYLAAVGARLTVPANVRALLRLAESRRQTFRRRRLHEFAPTLASIDERVADLAMTPKGRVVRGNHDHGGDDPRQDEEGSPS